MRVGSRETMKRLMKKHLLLRLVRLSSWMPSSGFFKKFKMLRQCLFRLQVRDGRVCESVLLDRASELLVCWIFFSLLLEISASLSLSMAVSSGLLTLRLSVAPLSLCFKFGWKYPASYGSPIRFRPISLVDIFCPNRMNALYCIYFFNNNTTYY